MINIWYLEGEVSAYGEHGVRWRRWCLLLFKSNGSGVAALSLLGRNSGNEVIGTEREHGHAIRALDGAALAAGGPI